MTKQYDNTNRGAIWKNDRKESERHPDFKGMLNVEGVEYSVAAWKRAPDANRNQPALRFQIERKEQPPEQEETPAAEQPKFDSSVDIPF